MGEKKNVEQEIKQQAAEAEEAKQAEQLDTRKTKRLVS